MRIKRYENKNEKGNRRGVFKPINIFVDNMDKFEEKETKKRKFQKKTLGTIV